MQLFIESLVNHIDRQLSFDVGLSIKEEDCITVRIIPGTPMNADLAKGQSWDFSFQVLSKNTSHMKAYKDLLQITDLLHGVSQDDIQDDEWALIVLECTTTPNWLETTNRNQTIYTALYSAEIIKK